MMRRGMRVLMLVLPVWLAAPAAFAGGGQVIFSFGQALAHRDGEGERALTRGSRVEQGDTLRTGTPGLLQIRMDDGALLALRAGSEMKILIYDYTDKKPVHVGQVDAIGAAIATRYAPQASHGRAFMSLLRGGMRTITGMIGKGDFGAYQLQTPVATIGIRGTHYVAAYCNGDCAAGAENGLHVGVAAGRVVVQNDAGVLTLEHDEYGFVPSATAPPQQQLQKSPALDDAPPAGSGGAQDQGPSGGADSGATQGPQSSDGSTAAADPAYSSKAPQSLDSFDPGPGLPTRQLAYATGPFGASPVLTGATADDAAGSEPGAGGNLDHFQGVTGASTPTLFQIGSAQQFERGGAAGMDWGRWSGGTAQYTPAAGAPQALDLSTQSLHWIYGRPYDPSAALPLHGTASYTLIGNTSPTDSAGHVGVLGGTSTFSANFDTAQVSNTIHLAINSQNWDASGSAALTSQGLFNANYSSVQVNGSSAGTSGSFSGFMVLDNGRGTPQGAGLSYGLNNGATTVSGVAAFGHPH